MNALAALLVDLKAESYDLQALLEDLQPSEWDRPSAAVGWSIRDQVSHLAFFDDAAVMAATDPDRFKQEAARLWALGPTFPDIVAENYREMSPGALMVWFRDARERLLATFGSLDGSQRVPWFGPDMSVTSSATARFMETWAHGLDVFESFGCRPAYSPRLKHIAHLGVRTRGFSFALRELPVPTEDVRVELTTPDDDAWVWGDSEAANSVTGSALDFCLVVTQRRNRTDTDLVVVGSVADSWLDIAQAFAGAPGPGRSPIASKFEEKK